MSGSEYMGLVARLSCASCRRRGLVRWPVEVHHIREGTGFGRASDTDVIPLCHECHQGAEGIHGKGSKAWKRMMGATELELVYETKARVRIMLSLEVTAWGRQVPDFLVDSGPPQTWPNVRPLSVVIEPSASSPTPQPSMA